MGPGLPAGTKLGRYEVVKHLARGGMADLSIARATGIENFERHVVIKHLRPEQSKDRSFVQMFVKEARLAGALHHHNIVQVHDIGQSEGRHFFAMEYVHGEDLRRVLSKLNDQREQPPLHHVVTIATAVCSALHHAHEQKGPDRLPLGIVHRDVTPGNILVSYDGNVKVVDFGIAKAALRTADTAVGMIKGKVPYMAPEQCTGKTVDRRSDVFALGIVLYELVTVRRLFKGANEYVTMAAVVSGEIPKPSTHRKDLPGELEAIILKALSRDPADRYQTADEMRLALEAFADKAGLRTSVTALSDYMKKVFGEQPEPWMVDISPALATPVDFDKTDVGVVEIVETAELPKLAANGSLMAQAHRTAGAIAIPSIVGRPKPPPPLPRRAPAPAVIEAEGDDHTDVSEVPIAPPFEPVIDKDQRDATEIVAPLPRVGDVTDMNQARRPVRPWLLLGGATVAALTIAIAIMLTGRSGDPVAPRELPKVEQPAVVTPRELPKVEQPAVVTPRELPKVEQPAVVEPPAPAPEPVANPVEPAVASPEPAPVPASPEPTANPEPAPPAIADKPRPIRRPAVRKPAKPVPKNPQWDPDALFLKPKK